ncbi:Short-chain collagen C4 [Holothuria leucospilota]|uniref:Short-chain collagen C4 n=1 Tax=Holothuria leucospilota TaxID=206669 RepID=A0A9Q1CL48_HOLLE|nr:Short-chain collagen C4 [Holothuria leucospilota]
MDGINHLHWLLLIVFVLSLPSAELQFQEKRGNKLQNSDYEISDPISSLDDLQQKTEAHRKFPIVKSQSLRSRRNVDDSAQMPENLCRGCSTAYTPYYSGQCFLCPPGNPGARGPPGQQGIPGRDGRDGRDATVDGITGSEDPQACTGNKSASGGTVYVRWGRNECPIYSELVYQGVAGGAYFSHKGSGSNYLCMPEDPIYDEPMAGSSGQERGFLYGGEYETNTFDDWSHLHNNDVPCAVCWTFDRSSLMMIPAKNVCPGSEWTKEYAGYLVSAFHSHEGRTEFVCMDRDAEAIPRTAHSTNGALFYIVEGRCGSSGSGLPCGPYVDGYELTCVVCSR